MGKTQDERDRRQWHKDVGKMNRADGTEGMGGCLAAMAALPVLVLYGALRTSVRRGFDRCRCCGCVPRSCRCKCCCG